ncbi:MAG: DUF3800 domain-containing protein [Promethearchaeota archaeon]|jgi:hypothetical protein
MVLGHIDESGNPSLKDKEEIFVLSAVLIQEQNYQNIDLTISNLKERLSYQYNIPDEFEFHVLSLLANRTKRNKPSAFDNVSYNERRNIYLTWHKSLKNLDFKIISVAILKKELTKEFNVRFWANLFLLERIQMYTQELTGNHQAIIFMDSESEEWNQKKINILKTAIYYPENHPSFIKFKNIVPNIYFLDSGSSMGIQLADSVVYCIRRWLRFTIYGKEGEIEKTNNKCFEIIKKKIRGYPDCLQTGLKIFPKKDMTKVRNCLL